MKSPQEFKVLFFDYFDENKKLIILYSVADIPDYKELEYEKFDLLYVLYKTGLIQGYSAKGEIKMTLGYYSGVTEYEDFKEIEQSISVDEYMMSNMNLEMCNTIMAFHLNVKHLPLKKSKFERFRSAVIRLFSNFI